MLERFSYEHRGRRAFTNRPARSLIRNGATTSATCPPESVLGLARDVDGIVGFVATRERVPARGVYGDSEEVVCHIRGDTASRETQIARGGVVLAATGRTKITLRHPITLALDARARKECAGRLNAVAK